MTTTRWLVVHVLLAIIQSVVLSFQIVIDSLNCIYVTPLSLPGQ